MVVSFIVMKDWREEQVKVGEDQNLGWNMMLEMPIRCAKREKSGRMLDKQV